jgi:hypothetical protein
MAKFLTIGYGDQRGYDDTADAVKAAAHAHDSRLATRGALIGVAGSPVQVRNHDDAGVQTQAGAFLRSALPVAGFALVEAADLDEAVGLVAQTPCAVAHGVVEIWPLLSFPE